jgi:hypothetical protein
MGRQNEHLDMARRWAETSIRTMEKSDKIHVVDLSRSEFERFPIWTWDDAMEGYHPILGDGDLPDEYGTLFIRATFTLPSGKMLPGYLVGLDSFYAFGIFIGENEFFFNLNLPDMANSSILEISRESGGEPVLPLQYKTDFHWADQPPISGVIQSLQ